MFRRVTRLKVRGPGLVLVNRKETNRRSLPANSSPVIAGKESTVKVPLPSKGMGSSPTKCNTRGRGCRLVISN
ncbi:MAG: hypothetical protein GF308_05850 [Candidatus Heimdallarchaeota archaeon]|nr:hypothetical protein [Candidatus Heimdallarchaeota archaeon]